MDSVDGPIPSPRHQPAWPSIHHFDPFFTALGGVGRSRPPAVAIQITLHSTPAADVIHHIHSADAHKQVLMSILVLAQGQGQVLLGLQRTEPAMPPFIPMDPHAALRICGEHVRCRSREISAFPQHTGPTLSSSRNGLPAINVVERLRPDRRRTPSLFFSFFFVSTLFPVFDFQHFAKQARRSGSKAIGIRDLTQRKGR